jgi:Mn2+/Fe2+ NRAMP family transporter
MAQQAREIERPGRGSRLRRLFNVLGPGLIAGASDDDPTAIATYAAAGAAFGYSTLWTAVASYPLMAAVQFICAKIGLVTGRLGLASVIRREYSRWVLYPAAYGLLIANTINIGADLGAIAAGMNLWGWTGGRAARRSFMPSSPSRCWSAWGSTSSVSSR